MIILLSIKLNCNFPLKIKLAETQKIKLLIFIPTLECGGAEKYVSRLCNNIDTTKFDITLAVLNNARPFFDINRSIEVIDLHKKRVSRSLFAIKKLIRQKQPDIVYTLVNHLNLLFAIFRWMFPRHLTIIAWESSIVSINTRRASFPKIYNWLLKRFYRRLDHIICQSAYMQQDLVSNYHIPENKITVINNPVDLAAKNDPGISIHEHRDNKYKFITVARLSEEKGIDRLIRAVAQLSMPFRYHIIGEGDQRKMLQDLITQLSQQGNIFLEGEKKYPYTGMENADLALMGSWYEGFPNTLLEAGALGIPVIAFDAPGGIGEIIDNGVNGLLVNNNDEKAFSSSIEKALQMDFDRNSIREDTIKRYDIKLIVAKTEELFVRSINN